MFFFFTHLAFAGDNAQKKPGPNARVVKHILQDPIPYGQAHCIHLEVNSFAVKIPGLLMVFDYANDEPVPQWNPFTKKMRKHYDRSLLTGVIEPEEIKDETVVFFFSHDHPGELFPKVLEWKDKISQTYYVVTQEIYEKNKTKLEEAKITDRVKVAKPNHAFKIKNCVIRTLPPQSCSSSRTCSGVEFLVETTNGVNIYHAGANGCPLRVDTKISDNPKTLHQPSGVIGKDTKKVIFRQGELVSSDERDTVESVNLFSEDTGVRNIGFAVYSTPDVPYGYMRIWSTALPRSVGGLMGVGGFGREGSFQELDERYHGELKARSKEHDRFVSSLPDQGVFLERGVIRQEACEKDLRVYKFVQANTEVLSALEKVSSRFCRETAGNVNAYENYDFTWYGLQGDEERARGDSPGYFSGYFAPNGVGLHSRMSWNIFQQYNDLEGGLD